MNDVSAVVIYVILLALDYKTAFSVFDSWGTYERCECYRWGLAFTVYDEQHSDNVVTLIKHLVREWVSREYPIRRTINGRQWLCKEGT